MKPQEILKTSILDLLFENRNKQYGAYELRKNYPTRLKKSLAFAVLLISSFFILISSFSGITKKKILATINNTDKILKTAVEEKKKEKKIEEKEKVKKVQGNPNVGKSAKVYSTPIFTKRLTDIKSGETNFHANTNAPNTGGDGKFGNTLFTDKFDDPEDTTTVIVHKPVKVEPEIELPSSDEAYPGGRNAMMQYLQENLQDEAIEDDMDKKVTVSFWVEADGTVTEVLVQNNDDEAFKRRTKKVFEKMKKWSPKVVKGFKVRSFRTLHVTIVLPE